MAEPPDQLDERPIASDVIEQDQMAATVRTALNELPERQRAALSLCYFDDLSNIEAAQVMEVSVEAMESLLARGRRGLKKILQGQQDLLVKG